MTDDRGNLYVITGLDGAGKSTVSQRVADELDAYWDWTPGDEYADERDDWHTDAYSSGGRFAKYMAANEEKTDQIREHLDAGRDVVLDRYVIDTLAYRQAEVHDDIDFGAVVDAWDVLEPDAVFFLEADDDVRMDRLQQRGEELTEEELNSDFMDAVADEYDRLTDTYGVVTVDTNPHAGAGSDADHVAPDGPDDVVDTILDVIRD